MKKIVLTGMMTALIFSATAMTPSAASVYEVKPGDNLYRIALAQGVTIDDLKKWNSLSTDALQVSQQLQIGSATAESTAPAQAVSQTPATAAPAAAASTASTGDVYRVQSGDSLYKIGKKFNMSINELKSLNQLTSDRLFVNQSLKVKGGAATVSAPASTASATKSPGMAVSNKPLAVNANQFYADAVAVAMQQLGTPYVFGGSTPAGFDCSGFIHYVYSKAGLNFGRTSSAGMYQASTEVTNPAFGDLVFFANTYTSGISHTGIFIGNNSFIHAGSKGIEITRLDNPYWKNHFVSFNRLHAVGSMQ